MVTMRRIGIQWRSGGGRKHGNGYYLYIIAYLAQRGNGSLLSIIMLIALGLLRLCQAEILVMHANGIRSLAI